MIMETTFTFRNLESTEGLRQHALEKMKKLGKYMVKPVAAHVILHVERFQHIAEITLSANGAHYIGSDRSNDMYSSIDGAITKLLTQIKRDRDRHKPRKGGM